MFLKLYNLFLVFFFKYPTPSNLSYMWNFGVLALIFFIIQLITGIFLSMFYVANADLAFLSIENIMRNIAGGWLLRYLHANGASFFFIFVYLHLFRNLYYKTYLPPRRGTWLLGVIILLLMILTAFTGYVLPWGQMSFWAATVITNLFSSVPLFGDDIVLLLWGNFTVSNTTLNRFFSFHFLLPFFLLCFIGLHLIFLHERGSSNPVKVYFLNDKIFFHPYFTLKDVLTIIFILVFLFLLLNFNPNLLGHSDNYIQANPLVTPSHIVPEWYFLLFYAILRSVPSKLGGFIVLLFSILILFIFPFFLKKFSILPKFYFFEYRSRSWIRLFVDKYDLRNIFSYKQTTLWIDRFFLRFLWWYNYKKFKPTYYHFLFSCVFLSILGSYPAEGIYLIFSKIFMILYFLYFLFIIVDNVQFSYVSIFILFCNYFSLLYYFYLSTFSSKCVYFFFSLTKVLKC